MKKSIIKKILICILGTCMLGGGMGMLIRVGIGSDSISCFYEGLSMKLPITVGTISLIMNIIYLIVVYILDKKKIGISTFVFMILGKFPIDFMNEHFFTPDSLIVCILLDIVICVIIGIGCSVIIKADFGVTAYDALTLSVTEKLKKNYVVIRYVFDGLFLLLGFIFGGTIGIGTIIAFIVIGPVFNKSKEILIDKK